MKIVAICGSPRKGNTEWMLRTLLEGAAGAGVETELILLRGKDIRGCDGCLSCEQGGQQREGACRIKDDMPGILLKLTEADGLALGTPVYFELLSGVLKNFMDRTCPIWPRLGGKPVAGIAVAEEGIGKAIDNLKTYSRLCGMPWVGSVTTLAKNPHEASRDKDLERRLQRLGRKLVRALNVPGPSG